MSLALAIAFKLGVVSGTDFEIEDHSDGEGPIIAVWNLDRKQPTKTEQAQWIVEYESHMASIEYQRLRAGEYPPIVEQLDLLWHDIDEGKVSTAAKSSSWYLAIKAVKDEFPKA
jgi:hypothetical protein